MSNNTFQVVQSRLGSDHFANASHGVLKIAISGALKQQSLKACVELVLSTIDASWQVLWQQNSTQNLADNTITGELIQQNPQQHMLSLAIPVCGIDGMSLAHIYRLIVQAYGSDNQPSTDLLPYEQYAQWQQSNLEDQQDSYWQEWIATEKQSLELPFVPSGLGGQAKRALVELELSGQAAHQQIQSSWVLLLGRLLGNKFAVGLVCDGRVVEDFDQAIGAYAVNVPLSFELDDDTCVDDVMAMLEDKEEDCLDGQVFVPQAALMEDQVCEHSVATLDFAELISIGDCEFSIADIDYSCGLFTTQLVIIAQQSGVKLRLYYDVNRYNQGDMRSLLASLANVIELNPSSTSLSQLQLLTAEHQELLVDTFNKREVDLSHKLGVCQLLEHWAQQRPDDVAVLAAGQSLSYGQLNHRANQLANYIQTQQITEPLTSQSLIGVCCEHGLDLMVAIMAAMKTGCAYVPVDPAYPDGRKNKLLSQCACVLVDNPSSNLENAIVVSSYDVQQTSHERQATVFNGSATAYVLYTSGSTGQPKGVMVSQDNLCNYLWAANEQYFTELNKTVVHSPISFDLTVTGLFLPLTNGGCVELVVGEDRVAALEQCLMAQQQKVFLKLTPAHLKVLKPWLETLPREKITVAVLVVGGEQLVSRDLRIWFEKLSALRVFNEYGPTETTVGASFYEAKFSNHGVIPIGEPLNNTQLYVLDRYMQPVIAGVTGELYIGGSSVAQGYLNDKPQTDERFVQAPASLNNNGLLYRTGDMVKFDVDTLTEQGKGLLVFAGRNDEQVKIRGYRIETAEIEGVMSSFAGVQSAVVYVHQVNGADQLVAFAQGSEVDEAKLNDYLVEQLPAHMVPQQLLVLPRLLLTVNGKVDKKALLEKLEQSQQAEYEAPTTEAEIALANIWQSVLELEQVSISSNFFELGGDSIRAVYVVADAKEQGYEFTVQDIFNYRDIKSLALHAKVIGKSVDDLQNMEMAELLENIDQLDEAQVEKLMKELD